MNMALFYFWFLSFLTKSKKDMEVRKWAAEGLSFLTMDAEVKVSAIDHIRILSIELELACNGG